MNDPRPLYEQAAAAFGTLLKSVTPDRLDDPTPCSEFDIRALLSHSVDGLRLAAHIGEGGEWNAAPPMTEGVADSGWGAAYDDAHRSFVMAWSDDAKLDRMVSSPWTEKMPGSAMVAFYVLETAAHSWDLAQALGQPLPLDPALAEEILPMARKEVPASPRGGAVPFGEVREAPATADAHGRLAAWLGREVPHPPQP